MDGSCGDLGLPEVAWKVNGMARNILHMIFTGILDALEDTYLGGIWEEPGRHLKKVADTWVGAKDTWLGGDWNSLEINLNQLK